MQIRIYLDGTFESLSATKDPKAELTALRADLKIITQVEKLRVARDVAKKASNSAKDKELLGKIKALKAKLSSNRNSSTEIITAKIGKLKDASVASKVTRGNKTGDPRRNPTRLKRLAPTKVVRKPKEANVPAAKKERAQDLENHIGIMEGELARLPHTKKSALRRQLLRDNIREQQDKLAALVKSGKKAAKPAAPARKPRSKPAAEKALDRVHNAENKLIEYRQTKAKITELQKQKVQTAGHTRRAAIDKQIETLQAKLDALSPAKK